MCQNAHGEHGLFDPENQDHLYLVREGLIPIAYLETEPASDEPVDARGSLYDPSEEICSH